MNKVSNEELTKLIAFMNSCDDMINGKFILADIKILKILNMIANSEELFHYISECMIDFNFEREFHRSEVKNRFNGGTFVPPSDPTFLVAMVFSLLVEFDSKRLDFYNFINTNFKTLKPGGEYANFANTLLLPFKNTIAEHYGILNYNKEELTALQKKQAEEEEKNASDDAVEQPEPEPEIDEKEKIWQEIPPLVDSLIEAVYAERKIKANVKEDLVYILKSIKSSLRYKDMQLVSAMLTAVDVLTVKTSSVKFILADLKKRLLNYYETND